MAPPTLACSTRCISCGFRLWRTPNIRCISSRALARQIYRKNYKASPDVPSCKILKSSPLEQRQAPVAEALQTIPQLKSPGVYSNISYGRDLKLQVGAVVKGDLDESARAAEFFEMRSRFLYSASTLRDHPYNEHVPEIVILGASNVGKSSFLNALVGRPGTARVGPRPGKTTLMNAYGVGPNPNVPRHLISAGTPMPAYSLIVLDTPGYGFKSQTTWGDAILKYLEARKALRGAVLLLSSEKRTLSADKRLLKMLAETNTRILIVITKADKCGHDWPSKCSDLARSLQLELQKLQRITNDEWKDGSGWISDIHVTAAGMSEVTKVGNKGGVGGVRARILEMAGLRMTEADVTGRENTAYTGKIVSFDDIQWKV